MKNSFQGGLRNTCSFVKKRDKTYFTLGWKAFWSNATLFAQEMCSGRKRTSSGASAKALGIIT